MAQRLKRLAGMRETRVRSLGWEDPLEKEMATQSSTLAWRIPWREEPGRLKSMGSQRVGHDWATSHTHCSSIFSFVRPLQNFLQWLHHFNFSLTVNEGSFSTHPYQHLFFVFFLMIAIRQLCGNSSLWFWFAFSKCLVMLSISSMNEWTPQSLKSQKL